MAEIAWHFKLTKKNFMHPKYQGLNQQICCIENCQYYNQRTYPTTQKISKKLQNFSTMNQCQKLFAIISALTTKQLYVDIKINSMPYHTKVLLDPKATMNAISTKFTQKIKMKSCKLKKQYLLNTMAECNST